MSTQQLNDLLYKAFTVDGNGNIALRMTLQTGTVQSWKDPVASLANLPPSGNTSGDVRMTMDTGLLYRWNWTAWVQANAYSSGQGISISGQTVAIDLDANSGLQFISGKLALKADWTTTEISSWSLRVKPGVFASLVHTHISSDITDWTTALNTWLATKTTANLTENTNLYFTQARVLATPLTGLSLATSTAIVATDTELVAFGKLQKQISDEVTARSNADATKEGTITAGTTAQYWRGDKSWQTLNTTAVAEGANLYYTNSRGIGSVLTGLSLSTSTDIVATDSILTAMGKLQAQNTAQGTAIGLRALDSGVVHIAGTETITGTKLFVDPRFNTTLPSGVASVLGTSNNPLVNIYANYWTGTEVATYLGATFRLDLRDTETDPIFQVRKKPATKLTADAGGDIKIFAVGGNWNVQIFGNVGIGTTNPSTYLEIYGNGSPGGIKIKNNSSKTILDIGADGAYQRAFYANYTANSQSDNSAMRFTTFVDRDSAIVGVDTYQIWGYPTDNAGTILDYAPLVQYNYDRVNQKLAVAFPRTSAHFEVWGQNWMNGWTGWTPTVNGDSSVNVTYTFQSGRYQKLWKRIRIVSSIQINAKWTTAGNVYIDSPETLNWYDAQSIKVNWEWISSAGAIKWRVVKYNATLMLQKVGSYSRGWTQATWADMADGDIIQINDDLELA